MSVTHRLTTAHRSSWNEGGQGNEFAPDDTDKAKCMIPCILIGDNITPFF